MVNQMPEFFRLEMGLPMQQSHHLICPGCGERIGAWAGPAAGNPRVAPGLAIRNLRIWLVEEGVCYTHYPTSGYRETR